MAITWNGSYDGNLNEGMNWNGGVPPSSSDDVIIANAGTMPNTGYLESLNSLVFNNGVNMTSGYPSFNVMGTITINGTIGGGVGFSGNPDVVVGATGQVTGGYSLYGTWTVYGSISGGTFYGSNYSNPVITVKSGGSISGGNFSSISGSTPGVLIESGGSVTAMSGFPFAAHNYGTWSAGYTAGGEFKNYNQLNGGTYSNGYFTNDTGGTVNSGTFPASLSYISNYGTIAGGDWRGHTRVEVGGTITGGIFTGDTITWTGGTSSVLGLAANWSPAYVPIAGDVVSIPVSPTRNPDSGTCVGTVTNDGTIAGGTWSGVVTNNNVITAGYFTAQTRASTGGTVAAFYATRFTDDPKLWNGSASGNVATATNWTGGLPTAGQAAYIAPLGTAPSSGTITCASVDVDEYASLSCNTNCSGYVFINGYISGGTHAGTVGVASVGNITGGTFNGTVTSSGAVAFSGTPIFNSTFINNGTIHNGTFNSAVTNNSSHYINNGTFSITSTVHNEGVIVAGIFNGDVTNTNGGTINNGTYNAAVDNGGVPPGIINDGIFTVQLRSTAGGTINGGTWPLEVKYWYSTSSTNWATLSNWWNDSGHTSQATELPKVTDNVTILGTIVPVIDIATWTQPASIDCTAKKIVITNSTAPTKVAISCPITGECEFQTGININSTIVGNCSIYGDSELTVTSTGITGTVKLYNTALNSSTITGEATFMGSSANAGTITGNAIFAEKSTNSGTASGWEASDCFQKDSDFGKYVWQPRLAGMKSFIKTGV